eukprot:scaffold32872_cov84-Phaeocystis_antarctica.AAC.4
MRCLPSLAAYQSCALVRKLAAPASSSCRHREALRPDIAAPHAAPVPALGRAYGTPPRQESSSTRARALARRAPEERSHEPAGSGPAGSGQHPRPSARMFRRSLPCGAGRCRRHTSARRRMTRPTARPPDHS